MSDIKEMHSGLTYRLVFGSMIIVLCVNIIYSIIGYMTFTRSFTREYGETAYYTALTAAEMVNGNRIDDYLEENRDTTTGVTSDYRIHWNDLEKLRATQGMNAIYVITVNAPDYDRITSVYNTVDTDIYPSIWPVGYTLDSEEPCRDIYRYIYETGGNEVHRYLEAPRGLNGSVPFVTAFAPITDDGGNVTALMCVQRGMAGLAAGRMEYLRKILIAFVCVALVTGVTLAAFMRRRFVKPTRRILDEAIRFSRENTLGSREVFEAASSREIREIRVMSETLEKMEMDTVRSMENLKKITAEQQRLRTELSLAWEIQNSVLPGQFPAFPGRNEFDIYATMTPAKDVGGDFYDYFLLDEDHLGLVMADVSGKGVPAALFMMISKLLIQTHAMMGGTPAQILERVNRELCKQNTTDMFVTVWLGILTISTGEMIAANGGHEYPVIGRRGGEFEILRDEHSLVLGALEYTQYHDYTFRLEPGDTIFLYTDGVTEAVDPRGKLFGTHRLLTALNEHRSRDVSAMLREVLDELHLFAGEEEPADDITMMALTMYCEEPETSPVQTASLDLAMEDHFLEKASDFLEEQATGWGIAPGFRNTLLLVLDEVGSNLVNYSGADRVRMELEYCDETITIRLIDNGIHYDPTDIPEPDLSLPPEERELGGLGMMLVRRLMNRIEYRYEDGRNILTLEKEV